MLTKEEVLELIPQKKPFRFIDRIVSIDAERAVGEYTFRTDETFYAGHFPGDPVTPGVILLETMCQTGVVAMGLYLLGLEVPKEEVARHVTLLTESEVEFERVIRPGEKVRIEAEKIYWRRRKLKSKIVLTLADGTPVARSTVGGMGVPRDRA
jgi:3-hydroxyacyl-[acyl-carrier-protein] dehydratase